MKVKSGTVVYFSEFGYYNFIYPTKENPITLKEDCLVLKEITWWMHDKRYMPYLIKYKDELKTIWIEKESVKKCMID